MMMGEERERGGRYTLSNVRVHHCVEWAGGDDARSSTPKNKKNEYEAVETQPHGEGEGEETSKC